MSIKKKSKIDLVEAVCNDIYAAGNSHVRKGEVKIIVESFLKQMRNVMSEGYQIELRGFGVFEFRYRKPKNNARNPRTGQKVQVAGHTVVAFRAGHELKTAVWNSNFGNK